MEESLSRGAWLFDSIWPFPAASPGEKRRSFFLYLCLQRAVSFLKCLQRDTKWRKVNFFHFLPFPSCRDTGVLCAVRTVCVQSDFLPLFLPTVLLLPSLLSEKLKLKKSPPLSLPFCTMVVDVPYLVYIYLAYPTSKATIDKKVFKASAAF